MSTDPTSRTIHLSLADILAAVRTASLPERRRQEMASALRTIGRVLDRPLERIPAIPRLLAIQLSDVAPRAAGISQARWNNVRALARAAIALVRPVSPGRQLNELSPAWKLLVDHLGRGVRASLSRLLRFCSAHGIGPENVYQETFDQFRLFLSEVLLPDPEKALIRTKRAWRAAQELESWPRLTVEVPDRSEKWTLTWVSFPASLREDFNRWRDRLAGRDLLDETPYRAVGSTTLTIRESQVSGISRFMDFNDFLLTSGVPGTDLTDDFTVFVDAHAASIPEPSSAEIFASALLIVGWLHGSRASRRFHIRLSRT